MTSAPVARVEYALLVLLALLWGSSYLFIRVAVETIPPVTLIAARVSIAAVVLGIVVAWRGDALPREGRIWGRLLIQAFLNSIGAWTVLAWGRQFVESGLASVLNSTSPIFVLLFTLVTAGLTTTGLRKVIGAGLGLVGVVLIVGPDVLRGLGQEVMGQLACLLGAVLYAGAALYGRHLSHLPATVTAFGTMLWAVVCLVPAAMLIDRPWTLEPSSMAVGATLVLGVLCTGLALLVYFRLIRTIGSIGTASQSYLRAGIGVVLGFLILDERLQPLMAIGLAAAIIGVAMIIAPPRAARAR